DAAMIMHYMAARIPELPWLLDTIPQYGKINAEENANGLRIGNSIKVDNNTYRIPVYLNGYINGPIAAKFDIDGEVLNVEDSGNEQNQLMTEHQNNVVVIAGNGEFDKSTPVCYVTVKSNNQNAKFTNIRLNDVNIDNIDAMLMTAADDNTNQTLSCSPNPFNNFTSVNVNVPGNGNYILSIYDGMGNKVKTLFSGSLTAGNYSYNWFGTNDAGTKMQSGVYVYRLTGENVTLSNKVILSK
ncbi:MAG: FlgD immunoglobulin-like domain containing protein, partial [Ignavibacteria bacterium]|nr:FlgD immunoglobulin-like domain containing protein [Ignavibacteria bacterium]